MGQVRLEAHDPQWREGFARESARLREVIGDCLVELHHIGSTAIPGIVAKPIIDMLAVVTSVEALDARVAPIVAEGYEALGEFGIAGRRYFRKDDADGTRTHHLHAFTRGSPHVQRHLAFRDHLLAHPEAAREYDELKQVLARTTSDSRAYTDAKSDFIRRIEERATGG